MVKGLYFPGFREADSNPDLGGSRIKETAALADVHASSPAICLLIGGTREGNGSEHTLNMFEIT